MLPDAVVGVKEDTVGTGTRTARRMPLAALLEGVVRSGLLVVFGDIATTDGPVEPLGVVRVHRSRRGVDILRCSISGIGWRQRRRVRPGSLVAVPADMITTVRRCGSSLVSLCRVALKLGDLLLIPGGVEACVMGACDICIDGRNKSCQALAADLGLLSLLRLEPFLPVCQPRLVVLALIEINVKAPVDGREPLVFQSVQFLHRDPADFRPRLVLERVVVQELASKEQSGGEHAPDLTIRVVRMTTFHVDALGQVVHPKQNRGARQSCRCQNLGHKFAERRADRAVGQHNPGCHFGDIVGHQLDIIVEDSTDTTGHDDGWGDLRKPEKAFAGEAVRTASNSGNQVSGDRVAGADTVFHGRRVEDLDGRGEVIEIY